MKIKLEWLNELVDLKGLSVQEIVDRVSLYSIEVEGVERLIEASNIVVGHVLSKKPHPNADQLSLLTVDVSDKNLEIVCGAKNVDAGQYVIVALEGAVLPDGFKIKKAKIRDVESNGMVCSLQELGINKKFISEKYVDGIYYFDEPQKIGISGSKALNFDDEVIELGLTPNRGDLLSMLGVAYEFSAVFNRPLKPLTYDLTKAKLTKDDKITIEIKTPGCQVYYAQVIKGVEIKPSPQWLKSRLIAFGIRPINNCVDITNYILALFGQPLHAFDKDLLGNKIVVRNAQSNEKIQTLDEEVRVLLDTDIVITDGNKPVALAGVMGGLDTEITDSTTNIVLEAAVFEPMSVRKTSTRLGLRSESSHRFERGVDLNRTKLAVDYACYLFKNLANAKILEEEYVGIKEIKDRKIEISADEVNSLLGIKISNKEVKTILESLGLRVEMNQNLLVYIPNRRSDISIKEDLIEEVGRFYGYDKLPITHPLDSMVGELTNKQKTKRRIKNTLSKLGLYETVNYTLVTHQENLEFTKNQLPNSKQISLLMPLSEERKFLRRGLVPSLIKVLKYNYSRKQKNISIYELSNVYSQKDNQTIEQMFLSGAMTNEYSNTLWNKKVEIVDFYLIKGILDHLFTSLGLDIKYQPMTSPSQELHPTRTASLLYNSKEIGFVGQLHPKYALENDLDNVFVFEIDLSLIIDDVNYSVKYSTIPKLPSIVRDIAVVVNKDVLASDIVEAIKKSDRDLLSEVSIFDVYLGDKINADEKSIAFSLTFTSEETLTDDVINIKIKKILKNLEFKFNAQLRS